MATNRRTGLALPFRGNFVCRQTFDRDRQGRLLDHGLPQRVGHFNIDFGQRYAGFIGAGGAESIVDAVEFACGNAHCLRHAFQKSGGSLLERDLGKPGLGGAIGPEIPVVGLRNGVLKQRWCSGLRTRFGQPFARLVRAHQNRFGIGGTRITVTGYRVDVIRQGGRFGARCGNGGIDLVERLQSALFGRRIDFLNGWGR